MKKVRDEIASIVKTGKIVVGYKRVKKALLSGNIKFAIISRNCPNEIKEDIIYYSALSKIPYKIVDEDANDLGSICGKPFSIPVIGGVETENSEIFKGKRNGKN